MKKEEFLKLGLSEEDAGKAAKASEAELTGYVPKAQYTEMEEAKKQLEQDLTARDSQLEELKKTKGDTQSLRETITALQEQNAAVKAEYEQKMKQLKLDNAVEQALAVAGARNSKAVKALLDLENAELDEASGVKNLDQQLKALKQSEDTAFLFQAEKPKPPALRGVTPPESGASPAAPDVSKMNYEQMCAYLEANPGTAL